MAVVAGIAIVSGALAQQPKQLTLTVLNGDTVVSVTDTYWTYWTYVGTHLYVEYQTDTIFQDGFDG